MKLISLVFVFRKSQTIRSQALLRRFPLIRLYDFRMSSIFDMQFSRCFDRFHDQPDTQIALYDRLILKGCSGSHLLSHTVTSIVPSAAGVLTIVFGMGTGVTPRRIATGTLLLHFGS